MQRPTDAPPPTWRLHARVFKDQQLQSNLLNWARSFRATVDDPLQRWEQFHDQLRQKAFSLASPIESQKENDVSELPALQESLDREERNGAGTSELWTDLVSQVARLKCGADDAKAMSTVNGRGDFYRPAQWDLYEAPSSKPTTIPAVLDESGQEFKDAKDITDAVERRYGPVLGSPAATAAAPASSSSAAQPSAEAAIAELHATKRRSLTAAQTAVGEARFTSDQILAALDAERFREGLDLGTDGDNEEEKEDVDDGRSEDATGPDGLPVSVYWLLKDVCVPLLVDLANALMDGKSLSEKYATSRVVFKHKGGDRRDLANYHPVPIPDVAQRVIDRALSTRLASSSLSSFWPSSDLAYMRGGHSEDTYAMLQMVLTRIRKSREAPALMVILDQAKGFDQIDHAWLLQTLDHYGFGPRMRSLVRGLLLDNAHAVFSVNDSMTKPLEVERSILQNGSACSYLFLVAMLPLLDELDAAGVGITLGARPGPEVKIPYLASGDSVITFIRRPAQLTALRRRLDLFSAACPGQISSDKIKAIILTSPSDENSSAIAQLRRTCPWSIEVPRELVHLGRAINLATGGAAKGALASALADVRRIWNEVKSDDEERSYFSQTRLAERQVLPPLWSRTSFTCQPVDFAQQVVDAVGPFKWPDGDAIPFDILTAPHRNGGLGLPNPEHMHIAISGAAVARWLCKEGQAGALFQRCLSEYLRDIGATEVDLFSRQGEIFERRLNNRVFAQASFWGMVVWTLTQLKATHPWVRDGELHPEGGP